MIIFSSKRLIAILLSCALTLSGVQPAEAAPVGQTIKIPEALGKIEEVIAGASGKMVIYIQDAHDSLEAQENIAKIINYAVEHYGVKTVFEEGYEGPVPTDDYFGFIEEPQLKEKVSYFLLDKLRIGGAEYAHINRKKDFELIGADNLELHLENVRQYSESAKYQIIAAKELASIQTEIQKIADRAFPKELKEWMKLKKRLDENKIALTDYLKRMAEFLPVHKESYPGITILANADRSESRAPEKLKDLDAKKLFEEIEKYESAFAAEFLKEPKTRRIFEHYRNLALLVRLNEIELTQPEFAAAEEVLRKMNTREMAEFIAKNSGNPVVLSRRWETYLKNAIRFYELAHLRDLAVEKALAGFARGASDKPAILVFGGFHKNGIRTLLARQGFSVITISPRISELDPRHQKYYKVLMSAGHHAFEKTFLTPRAAKAVSVIQMKAFSEIRAIYDGARANPDLPFPALSVQIEKTLRQTLSAKSELRSSGFKDGIYKFRLVNSRAPEELEDSDSTDILAFNFHAGDRAAGLHAQLFTERYQTYFKEAPKIAFSALYELLQHVSHNLMHLREGDVMNVSIEIEEILGRYWLKIIAEDNGRGFSYPIAKSVEEGFTTEPERGYHGGSPEGGQGLPHTIDSTIAPSRFNRLTIETNQEKAVWCCGETSKFQISRDRPIRAGTKITMEYFISEEEGIPALAAASEFPEKFEKKYARKPSGDETALYYGESPLVSSSESYTAASVREYWDPDEDLYYRVLPHDNEIIQLAFSSDGKSLATVGYSDKAWLWNVDENFQLAEYKQRHDYFLGVTFSPDGKKLLLGDVIRGDLITSIREFDRQKNDEKVILDIPHSMGFRRLAFFDQGNQLAALSDEYPELVIWDWKKHEAKIRFKTNHDDMSVAPEKNLLALFGSREGILLYDLAGIDIQTSRKLLTDLPAYHAVFQPGSSFLAAGHKDGKVRLWNVETGQLDSQLETSIEASPSYLAFSFDGRWLAIRYSGAKEVLIYDMSLPGRPVVKKLPINGEAGGIAFSPDNRFLAVAENTEGRNKKYYARLWRIEEDSFRSSELRIFSFWKKPVKVDLKFPKPVRHYLQQANDRWIALTKLDSSGKPWRIGHGRPDRIRSEHLWLDADSMDALLNGDAEAFLRADPFTEVSREKIAVISENLSKLSDRGKRILIMGSALHDYGYYKLREGQTHEEAGEKMVKEFLLRQKEEPLTAEAVSKIALWHPSLWFLSGGSKKAGNKDEYRGQWQISISEWLKRLIQDRHLRVEEVETFIGELKTIYTAISLADIHASGDRHLSERQNKYPFASLPEIEEEAAKVFEAVAVNFRSELRRQDRNYRAILSKRTDAKVTFLIDAGVLAGLSAEQKEELFSRLFMNRAQLRLIIFRAAGQIPAGDAALNAILRLSNVKLSSADSYRKAAKKFGIPKSFTILFLPQAEAAGWTRDRFIKAVVLRNQAGVIEFARLLGINGGVLPNVREENGLFDPLHHLLELIDREALASLVVAYSA